MLATATVLFCVLTSVVNAAPHNITKRYSGKAGISWPVQEKSAGPVSQFFGANSNVRWWFDWNKNYGTKIFPADSSKVSVNGHFIPMQYDSSFLDNSDPLEGGWDTVMGYNEPDLHSSTGVSTPTSPGEAANNWKAMVTKLRAANPNVKLWSPAIAGDKQWLKNFFQAICPGGLSGCQWAPDYLAIHVFVTSGQGFIDAVQGYRSAFPGLDIVVSEFACYQFDGTNTQPSAQQVADFMGLTTEWLDRTPWIHKYAWFGSARNSAWLYGVSENNRLVTPSGDLTALGRQYIGGGHR